MSKVPYASAIGSLMYAMVCTRPDIAHAVGVVSRYMSNPGKQHWEAVKWILRYLKEAEYVVVTEVGKEMVWLQGFLEELGQRQKKGILHSDSQSAIFLAKNPTFHYRTKHIQLRYHFICSLLDGGQLTLEKILGAKNPADMLTKGVTIEKLKLCSTSVVSKWEIVGYVEPGATHGTIAYATRWFELSACTSWITLEYIAASWKEQKKRRSVEAQSRKIYWLRKSSGWLRRSASWIHRRTDWLYKSAGLLSRNASWIRMRTEWLRRSAGWHCSDLMVTCDEFYDDGLVMTLWWFYDDGLVVPYGGF
uniref:Reverse transcriptase Ty1/copia-type domain-containing protein n=1 Tax=Fagus sylvatica TaxID=28930 RepID=A0A2N9HLL9_FAGSY